MCDDIDNADWWKSENEEPETEDPETIEIVAILTDVEKKIAHYEGSSRRHWKSWKTYGSKVYLYQYKQANIKIRKLKQVLKENK